MAPWQGPAAWLTAVVTAASILGVSAAWALDYKDDVSTYKEPGQQCEPIVVPMCQTMPWNWTSMPNLVHQTNQGNAQLYLEQVEPLLETNCSDSLAFFLCAMFTPLCMDNVTQRVPPCRSVCEEARKGCEPILRDFKHSWPDFLTCDDLQEHSNSMCLSPQAFEVSTSSPQQVSACKCKSVFIFNKRDYHRSNFSHAIIATVVGQHKHDPTGDMVTVVTPLRIFKNRPKIVNVGRQTPLWTRFSSVRNCDCVQLEETKRYFIACRHDDQYARLILDTQCTVAFWDETWPHQISERAALDLLSSKSKGQKTTHIAQFTTTVSTATDYSVSPRSRIRHGRKHGDNSRP